MNETREVTVTEAVKKYELNRYTLISWIKKGKIIARQAGDNLRSPLIIDEASLTAHLIKSGKLEGSTVVDGKGPLPAAEPTKPEMEMPSLRSHKIESEAVPQTIPEPTPTVQPVERRAAPSTAVRSVSRRNSNEPSDGRRQGRKTSTYPVRLTMQQLKNAIRLMSLEETLVMRNWLNMRITNKVNG